MEYETSQAEQNTRDYDASEDRNFGGVTDDEDKPELTRPYTSTSDLHIEESVREALAKEEEIASRDDHLTIDDFRMK